MHNGTSIGEPLRLLLFNLITDASDPVLGFTTRWINGLAARARYVDVITMQRGELEVASNVRVFSVGKELGHNEAARAWIFYRHLIRLLRERRYDACFAHMMPLFAVMAAPLLKISKVPITLWYQHKSVTPMLRAAEKVVDRVVTASAESFRVPTKKLVVTGQGIDTHTFTPSIKPKDPFVLTTVGRIAPVKHVETFIDAVGVLRDRGLIPRVQARIVGGAYHEDAGYERRLRQQARSLGIEDHVIFVGPVRWRDTVIEYRKADVMVNLSATGSLDKAGLEAMSCGLPVVTSNPPLRRLVRHESPILDLRGDESLHVALACEALWQMADEDRNQLSRRMREIVEQNHSFEGLMAQLTNGALVRAQ